MVEECVLVNRNLLGHVGDLLRARTANSSESDDKRKRELGRDQGRMREGQRGKG